MTAVERKVQGGERKPKGAAGEVRVIESVRTYAPTSLSASKLPRTPSMFSKCQLYANNWLGLHNRR